jgi:Sulfotransferase domain
MAPGRDFAVRASSSMRAVASGALEGVSVCLGWLIHFLILCKSIVSYIKLRNEFRPRPDDIFIATYPRSGTTWMQMILYQMTSSGEMSFRHISEVCPWFERTIATGRDLETLPSPRVFKTHLRYYLLPKRPCRYIYIARDGKDVAISLFHFYCSHFGWTEGFSKFFKLFLRGRVEGGSWFTHVAGWRARRDDPNILFICYDDLVNDLENSVRKIADFCKLVIPEDQMPRITERSTFAFMKQYESQFDHINEVLWERQVREGAFLRKGQVGEGQKSLSDQQNDLFDRIAEKKLGTFPRIQSRNADLKPINSCLPEPNEDFRYHTNDSLPMGMNKEMVPIKKVQREL